MSISEIEDKGLPKGWILVALGSICKVEGGYAFKSQDYQKHGVLLVRISNLIDGNVEISSQPIFLPEEYLEKFPEYKLKEDDILIAMSGATTGKVAVNRLNKPALLNQRVGRFVIDNRQLLSLKYLENLVKSITSKVFESAYGGAQPNISAKEIESFKVPIPPLNEQKRIVDKIEELFSKLDAGIAALERVKANLKRYRAAVLKAAVEGKLTEEWRKQNPNTEPASKLLQRILKERRQKWESEQLEKYQKSGKTPPKDWQSKYKEPSAPDTANLLDLLDGWCWASIDQISEVGTGTTPLKTNSNFWENGSIPWVTSTMVNHLFVTEASDFITSEALEKTTLKLYPRHTLIMAMYGEGKTRGKVSELLIEATINQALAALQVSEKFIDLRKYLKFFLQGHYELIRKLSVGGVQPNLNLGTVQRICIPLPPLNEQAVIGENLASILSIIEKVETETSSQLHRSSRLRQSILKQAFSGKLVPQDPNDEPASLLLQRIQAEKANTIKAQPAKRQRQKVNDENSANIDPLG